MKIWNIVIIILWGILLIGCRKDIDRTVKDTIEEEPLVYVNCSVTGVVKDTRGFPLKGVQLQLDNYMQMTDDNGVFYFKDIQANQKSTVVRASLQGYLATQVSFIPIVNNVHILSISMTKSNFTGAVNGLSGGKVTLGKNKDVSISIPPDAWLLSDGISYRGEVQLYFAALEEFSPTALQQLPAALFGKYEGDTIRNINPAGAFRWEAQTTSGESLILADGKALDFDMPFASITEYPQEFEGRLDLLRYDPTLGFWKRDTLANAANARAQFSLSASGWWIMGQAQASQQVKIRLTTAGQEIIPFAKISIWSNGVDLVHFSGQTSDKGLLVTWLPVEEELTGIIEEGRLPLVDRSFTPNPDHPSIQFKLDLSAHTTSMEGRLVDCSGKPVQLGYFKINEDRVFPFHTSSQGGVSWPTFFNTDSILLVQGVDLNTGNSGITDELYRDGTKLKIGDLLACPKDASTFVRLYLNGQAARVSIPAKSTLEQDSSSVIIKVKFENGWLMNLMLPFDFNADTRKALSFSLTGNGVEVITGANVIGDVELDLKQIAKAKNEITSGTFTCKYEDGGERKKLWGDFRVIRKY